VLLVILPFPGTVALRLLALASGLAVCAWVWHKDGFGEVPARWALLLWIACALLSLAAAVDVRYSLGEIKNEIGYAMAAYLGFLTLTRSRADARFFLGALILGRARGLAEGEIRALAFTMLVVGNFALVLSNRSWSRSLIASLRQPNPALWALLAAALGVLGLTLTVPFLSHLFRFEELSRLDFAVAGGGGAICLLWCEFLKALRSRVVPRGQ
jgi:hypothetical protein